MTVYPIASNAFKKYGRVLEGYDFKSFLSLLIESTPMPEEGFIYKASDSVLQAHPAFMYIQQHVYGGMPIQLGYCNGNNTKLNCLEYHKSSEVCIMAYDTILLLGFLGDVENWQYDTAKVEGFLVPAGTGIELYATTLHYAPCNAKLGQGYKVANALPMGTNLVIPKIDNAIDEDRLLLARNKWLLAHSQSPEAQNGAFIGLLGENIDIIKEME